MKNTTISTYQERGPRSYQEDRIFFRKFPDYDILAVMDGHGGAAVAELTKSWLTTDHPQPTTLGAYVASLASRVMHTHMGTTLSLVAVTPTDWYMAVLGDSPVAVITGDQVVMGPDHNVRTNAAEAQAVQDRGGYILGGYACSSDGRGLQMSRALGDNQFSWISHEPELMRGSVSEETVIVVASDGCLDPGHSVSPMKYVRDHWVGKKLTAKKVVTSVKVLEDNASAIVWRVERNQTDRAPEK